MHELAISRKSSLIEENPIDWVVMYCRTTNGHPALLIKGLEKVSGSPDFMLHSGHAPDLANGIRTYGFRERFKQFVVRPNKAETFLNLESSD